MPHDGIGGRKLAGQNGISQADPTNAENPRPDPRLNRRSEVAIPGIYLEFVMPYGPSRTSFVKPYARARP
jgi:hypothetical protein